MHTPPLSTVPPGGVVSTPIEQFGRDRRGVKRPPLQLAREILAKDPGEVRTPPILPPFEQVSRTVSKEIRADTPPIIQTDRRVRTGAAERKSDRPMDEELRKTKIFGNRVPVPMESIDRTVRTGLPPSQQEPRNTGAVQRPTKPRGDVPATPPIYVPPQKNDDTRTVPRKPVQPSTSPRPDVPVYVPPRRSEPPPTYVPPKRDDPPPRSEPPKRSDPPKRESSPPKSDPPADRKPAPPLGGERKKDG
jgi:hypothetical protein